MTLNKAFKLLNLAHDSGKRDLSMNYHRLAKRWHPDNNPDNQELSHTMMNMINEAYQILVEHVYERSATSQRATSKATSAPSPAAPPYPTTILQERPFVVSREYIGLFDSILDAVFLYYQYSLENIHMRLQGVGRVHYKSAIRNLTAGIVRLETKLTQTSNNSVVPNGVTIFLDFARAFLDTIRIERYFTPTGSSYDTQVQRHYQYASAKLDSAIKHFFFHELNTRGRRFYDGATLEISNHEFMIIRTNFSESSWITETNIKIHLLNCFQKVCRLSYE